MKNNNKTVRGRTIGKERNVIRPEKGKNEEKRIKMDVITSVKQVDNLQFSLRLKFGSMPFYFRGQSDSSWGLLPTIVTNFKTTDYLSLERNLLKDFSEQLLKCNIKVFQDHPTDSLKFGKDWNLLFQSRHLELPNRLIDWTPDLRVALFFAVSKDFNVPGRIFFLKFDNSVHYNSDNINPKESILDQHHETFSKTVLINQSLTQNCSRNLPESRILNQFGRFLFQPIDQILKPFEETVITNPQFDIISFIIPREAKKGIMEELSMCNITLERLGFEKDSIFPVKEIDTIIHDIKLKYKTILRQ